MHYVGWPRAWDETFTEDDMRRRTRPLRVTGVMAPTGPLCRAPKKGSDRGIKCKIEDEGTLPAAKGRPTAEALYTFDPSINWSKRFPKSDQEEVKPGRKSKPKQQQRQQQAHRPVPKAQTKPKPAKLGQNSTHRCHQNKTNFNADARKNAATRGGQRAL